MAQARIEPAPCSSRRRKIDKEAFIKQAEQYPDADAVSTRPGGSFRGADVKKMGPRPIKKLCVIPRQTKRQGSCSRRKSSAIKSRENPYFIDESGFAHDARLYRYLRRGRRRFGTHDCQAKGHTNVIGVLLMRTSMAGGLFNGSINSDVFSMLWSPLARSS